MTKYTLNDPPDDADYRNPEPKAYDVRDSECRMKLVHILAKRSPNHEALTELVFDFGWDFGWSYRECMEAMVDAGYAYFDPIKGAMH